MERICSLLLDGSAPFDAPLSERAIADAIGLGRMPVREALRDLAREGILAVEPGRGTYLRQLSAREATELLEVRLAIEGMAARLAAEKGFVGDLPELVAVLSALAKRRLAGDRVREAEAAGDRVHWQIVQGAGKRHSPACTPDCACASPFLCAWSSVARWNASKKPSVNTWQLHRRSWRAHPTRPPRL